MFKPAPGKQGLELVPDLADRPGQVLRRRQDLDLQDPAGPEVRGRLAVTAKDIAYAVLAHRRPRRARSRARVLRRPARTGPRTTRARTRARRTPTSPRRSRRPTTTRSSSTSRSRSRSSTTSRQLPQTAPVPAAKDTGAKYTTHPISSGPYMFEGQRRLGTAARWCATPTGTPSTDPNRKALPDQIDVKLGLQADDLDNQIIAGDQDVDIAGTGVQPAALPKVLQDKDAAGPRGQPGQRASVVHPDHRRP